MKPQVFMSLRLRSLKISVGGLEKEGGNLLRGEPPT